MFFHKNRVQTYDNARDHDRPVLPDAEDIVVEIDIEDGSTLPIPCDLHDLHIGGAGVTIPAEMDPGLDEGKMVRLTVAHPIHGWSVTTPASVEYRLPEGGDRLRIGFGFVNVGNLYAQLDNAIVRYFNRRRGARIFTALDASFDVTVRPGGHEMKGQVHDFSRVGLSVVLDKQPAERCTPGKAIDLAFDLPDGGKPIKGKGKVSHVRDLGEYTFVGIDFDIEDKLGFAKHQERLAKYVLERRPLTESYEAKLARGEVAPLPMVPPTKPEDAEATGDDAEPVAENTDQDGDSFEDRRAA